MDGEVFGLTLDRVAVVAGEAGDDVQQDSAAAVGVLNVVVPVRCQLGVGLREHLADFYLELRQAVADVVHQDLIQRLGQVRRAAAGRDLPVQCVGLEELALLAERVTYLDALHNVLLAPVHHSDEAQAEGDHPPQQHVQGVGSAVHNIDLRDNPQRARALRVYLLGEPQGIGRGQVRIGGRHRQDDTVLLGYVLHDHIADLDFNIRWLVPHRNPGHPR
mmetsp:Transcript_11433/g.32103  ORF Transcript_11433/g.32103 Transcript_11433/m.32103 type:complete len:218 (-) Transcript_11433:663-1316(-)